MGKNPDVLAATAVSIYRRVLSSGSQYSIIMFFFLMKALAKCCVFFTPLTSLCFLFILLVCHHLISISVIFVHAENVQHFDCW